MTKIAKASKLLLIALSLSICTLPAIAAAASVAPATQPQIQAEVPAANGDAAFYQLITESKEQPNQETLLLVKHPLSSQPPLQ